MKTRCEHYSTGKCTERATVALFAPDGLYTPGPDPVPAGFWCQAHGEALVREYAEKCGETWTLRPIDEYGRVKPRYYVKDGHTLGYVYDEQPGDFWILHGSVLLGGHDWKNGSAPIGPETVLRPATIDDFRRFRVSPVGHIC